MSLAPLRAAPLAVQIHAVAAIAAFLLGIVQFALPKGTISHRALGWTWVLLMSVVAGSGLFIHEIRLWGPWSPIHLLVIQTLATLPFAVLAARRHEVRRHRNAMVGMFVGAMLVAGVASFLPGRIMHAVAFGN